MKVNYENTYLVSCCLNGVVAFFNIDYGRRGNNKDINLPTVIPAEEILIEQDTLTRIMTAINVLKSDIANDKTNGELLTAELLDKQL